MNSADLLTSFSNPGRPNVIGHGVGAVLGIAGLVWGSSTIQHQIQLQVATVIIDF